MWRERFEGALPFIMTFFAGMVFGGLLASIVPFFDQPAAFKGDRLDNKTVRVYKQ